MVSKPAALRILLRSPPGQEYAGVTACGNLTISSPSNRPSRRSPPGVRRRASSRRTKGTWSGSKWISEYQARMPDAYPSGTPRLVREATRNGMPGKDASACLINAGTKSIPSAAAPWSARNLVQWPGPHPISSTGPTRGATHSAMSFRSTGCVDSTDPNLAMYSAALHEYAFSTAASVMQPRYGGQQESMPPGRVVYSFGVPSIDRYGRGGHGWPPVPTRIGVRSTITVTYLSPLLVWCHMYPQSIHRCRRILTLRPWNDSPPARAIVSKRSMAVPPSRARALERALRRCRSSRFCGSAEAQNLGHMSGVGAIIRLGTSAVPQRRADGRRRRSRGVLE